MPGSKGFCLWKDLSVYFKSSFSTTACDNFFFFCIRARAILSCEFNFDNLKDGDYYCYCAYVLRISRYSNFLSVVLTNAGLFFARFKFMQRKQNLANALGIQKENWG